MIRGSIEFGIYLRISTTVDKFMLDRLRDMNEGSVLPWSSISRSERVLGGKAKVGGVVIISKKGVCLHSE